MASDPNFTVQYDPITNAPKTDTDILDLEVETDQLTDVQIEALLLKYTPARKLLFLYDAHERLIKEGQENWNGDKKSFEVRFDYLTAEIARMEKVVSKQLLAKSGKGSPACPVSICKVTVV